MYQVHQILGYEYDATIFSNGGTYHKVMIENVEDGRTEYFKFFSRDKAFDFAKDRAK